MDRMDALGLSSNLRVHTDPPPASQSSAIPEVEKQGSSWNGNLAAIVVSLRMWQDRLLRRKAMLSFLLDYEVLSLSTEIQVCHIRWKLCSVISKFTTILFWH